MTISSTNRKAGPYAGNDVAVSFPFAFKVFAAADVLVVFTSASNVETILTLTTNYTVSLNSNQDTNPGGTVTLLTALATGEKLTLSSAVANLQPVDLTNNGGFYPAVINKALDRATIQIQQLAEKVSRALVWPISSSGATLPSPESGKFIGWNDTADSLVNLAGTGTIADAENVGSNDGAGGSLWVSVAGFISRLTSSVGSSLVGFIQAGIGAVRRTMQDKMRESVSVLDFGADPLYTTDSTAAFQAAIMYGAWNGTDIYVPNGSYRIEGTIFIGAFGGNNCYSVTLRGESTHGSVLLRPAGAGTGPIITLHGFHNIVEKLTLISEVSGGAYSASHAIYIRGNPQAGTNGLGTKYCSFRNLKILRVGIGIQIGNYAVDNIDPDIETNNFEAIEITDCSGGVFVNGQNILHNPFYACHIVSCRDYLAKQERGADLWFERSYFGGMYDYLTNNYNVAATSKVVVTAGLLGLVGCRFEDWVSGTGNAKSRFAVHFSSTAAYAYIAGNTFTTRDNATTEPCCSFNGSGSAGSVATRAVLLDNQFMGYVEINTIDIFSLGNRYQGTGGSVVNGRLLSANQKTAAFRDVFMDSNQTMEFPGGKFKRNSSVPVIIERSSVATGSEWIGHHYYDEPGLLWGRIGKRVTNGTAAAESSVLQIANRFSGAYTTIGIGCGTSAPAAGTWTKGDRIVNSNPAVGSPKGWICTVAGTPGTWVSEGNL